MKLLLIALLGTFSLTSLAHEKKGKDRDNLNKQQEQFRESKQETRELMREQFEPNTEGLKKQQKKAKRKLRNN